MFKIGLSSAALVLGMLCILFGACMKTPDVNLKGTSWILDSYGEQGEAKVVLEGTEITAIFKSSGEVTGSAGCNWYGGDYEVNGNKLSIFQIASTEMACISPTGIMEQENEYLQALQKTGSFKILDGNLHLYCGGITLIYKSSDTGKLTGKITIGPLTPVEKPGETTTIPCEVYKEKIIMVYDSSGQELVKQVDTDCNGMYRVELKSGVYTIDIKGIGMDRSSAVPKVIEIESGETIVLDIDIDTGIR